MRTASEEEDARRPSGDQATEVTQFRRPMRVLRMQSSSVCQMRMVWSSEANPVGVAGEDGEDTVVVGIPDARGTVVGGGSEAAAIGRPGDEAD